MAFRIGIDLGGTNVKVGLVNSRLQIVKEQTVRTSGFQKPESLAKELALVSKALSKGHDVSHIGIGVAGDTDSKNGIVRVAPNLKWKNVPFKKVFQSHISGHVTVDNDANVAAWGIYNTQTPKGVKHILVLTLGTGVGGGIIIDGKIYRGGTGSAGEFGHLTIVPNGLPCNCGDKGCLEAYVGGLNLSRNVAKAILEGAKTRLKKIYKRAPSELTPHSIFVAAKEGDAFALKVWKEVGDNLGMAIGNLAYLFNPEMVFLTGGVAQAGELFLKPLSEKLINRAFETITQSIVLKVAKNPNQMGVIGAALL